MTVPDSDIQYAHCLLFVPAQSATLPLCQSQYKHLVVWPVNSPTDTWSFCLLIAWGPFVGLDTGSLIRVSDWLQPLQVFPPLQVLLPQMTLGDFFVHDKGNANNLVRRDSISPFLGQFISFLFPGITLCPCIHTKVTLLYRLRSSSACIHSHTRANSVGFLQVLLLLPYYQSKYVFSFCLCS